MTYIICEIGSNFQDRLDCLDSISAAKKAGADAVKFQLYNHKKLYGYDGPVMQGELNPEWLPKMKEVADRENIDFMCTFFDPNDVATFDPLVTHHKIASAEMMHTELLKAVSKTGKRLFLSTGAHYVDEIKTALTYLDGVDVTLMYCVASYPAKYTYTRNISNMRNTFNKPIGFSDHSLDVYEAPLSAVRWGAHALEKHVNFVGCNSPDSPHSLNGIEFFNMVKAIRSLEVPALGPTPDEIGMITTHNRRETKHGFYRLKNE